MKLLINTLSVYEKLKLNISNYINDHAVLAWDSESYLPGN